MRFLLRSLVPAVLLLACAQAQAQDQGTAEPWDIRAVLTEISAHAGRLVPLLDKVDPASWSDQGAPEGYQKQWKSARDQAQALSSEAAAMVRNPDKLSEALKVFFRMQALEFTINSLSDGVRKYQNPALGDLVESTAAENGANRERFQQFIVELAAIREQEYEVMDHEAQRCRALLSRQPPAKKAVRKSQ